MNLENMEWLCGEINESTKKVNVEFIPIDTKEFVEIKLDVTDIIAEDNLTEKINGIQTEDNKYYKIILTGNRNFEIKVQEIKKLVESNQVIKIKDNTKLALNIEELVGENSLRGIFVSNILQKINENPEEKEKLLKVIEIGIEAMDA